MHVSKPTALTVWHTELWVICNTWWWIIMPLAYELYKFYLYFRVYTYFLKVKFVGKQHTATQATASCILCSLCLLIASRGHMEWPIYTIKVCIIQSMIFAQNHHTVHLMEHILSLNDDACVCWWSSVLLLVCKTEEAVWEMGACYVRCHLLLGGGYIVTLFQHLIIDLLL